MEKKYDGIRYVKLHFVLEMLQDATLPLQKASMLRGGMGELLMRTCCISDRVCEHCGFEGECIVRRIMYSKMEIQPAFMSSGDSVGYVVECDNYMTEFRKGDRLEFRMLLIGKTIIYFSQILDAFYRLGFSGIGKENARFRVAEVLNSRKEPILAGNDIHMERVKVETLGGYIRYRMEMLVPKTGTKIPDHSAISDKENDFEIEISFKSPLSVKHQGEIMDEYDAEAIIKSAERRVYILSCFEGIEIDKILYSGQVPEIEQISCRKVLVPRFSFHKGEKMTLRGIEGKIKLNSVSRELLELLIAGELLHIGSNTSFGFGGYRIKICLKEHQALK